MSIPSSVLIVGSGVFGLSTAYTLGRDPRFSNSKITLVDRWNFEPSNTSGSVQNPGAANADTSRVIRRDYPHGPYASLAREAMKHWRADYGADGRYVEQRLLFAAHGSSLHLPKRKMETINYIKMAYDISSEMTPGGKDALKVFDSLAEIRTELGIPTNVPDVASTQDAQEADTLRGYISEDCGWANAGASIEWLRQQVISLNRVELVTGHVESLIFNSDKTQAEGVKLVDGRTLNAELTVVAAGSYTSHLLNLHNLCDVYSEVAAYIQLTEEECAELKRRRWPLLVDAHRGVFSVGPDHDNCLKLGHFSYQGMADVLLYAGIKVGPRNKTPEHARGDEWQNPEFGFGGELKISEVGDVDDWQADKMQKTLADYRAFLLQLLGPAALDGIHAQDKVNLEQNVSDPMLNRIANRPFTRVRKCWYNDTPSLDFILDYHPAYGKSLFVATGGCDHAFKFLPVIGDKVVALALHHRGVEPDASVVMDPPLEDLARLWKFPGELLQNGHS